MDPSGNPPPIPTDNEQLLFRHQSSLPRLPVPSLEETLALYVGTVRAVLAGGGATGPSSTTKTKTKPTTATEEAEAALERTEGAARDFAAPGSLGRELHERLVRHAARDPSAVATSWLHDLWNESAYLAVREPAVFASNYFFDFSDPLAAVVAASPASPSSSQASQVHRAALIVRAVYDFRNAVLSGSLGPDVLRSGVPLCSAQYLQLFNVCRIPATPKDYIHYYDATANNHTIVLRKGYFYAAPLCALSVAAIQKKLAAIICDADSRNGDDGPGSPSRTHIGLLTTAPRDTWARNRALLIEADPKNKISLRTIESAVFILCLDDDEDEEEKKEQEINGNGNGEITDDGGVGGPASQLLEDSARRFWHGSGRNRYLDKPLQFIVAANGRAGFNGEHSMVDATVTRRLCEWVLGEIKAGSPTAAHALNIDLASSSSSELTGTSDNGDEGEDARPPFTRVEFTLTPALKEAVEACARAFDVLSSQHSVRVLAYRLYGKNQIKLFGASPDAYVQIAMQLAFYIAFGNLPAIYETVQTRQFAYGRTETGRSLTVESVAFVKTMAATVLSLDAGVASEWWRAETVRLAHLAFEAHGRYVLRASKGGGVDRHLLGLRMQLRPGESEPELFTDPLYVESKRWRMSTSHLASEHFAGYGWGQVEPDGFGLAYMVKEDSLHVNIASLGLDNDAFLDSLVLSLNCMYALFSAADIG